jgi:hypothetical protein
MASTTRRWIRRKWLFAIGNITTAQDHLLDARTFYVEHSPEHVKLVDSCLTILEQSKGFLEEARAKV